MWWRNQKEQYMTLTEATETMLPIPLATEAKQMSIKNLDARIKGAEKAIFDNACRFINEQIERGHLTASFDAFSAVYYIDEKLDTDCIITAINDCIEHLSTFGYTAEIVGGRNLKISWQYPKEITLNGIEWSI